MRRVPAGLVVAAALAAPVRLAAQNPPPRDTIVVVPHDGGSDTTPGTDGASSRRNPRWERPFSVRSSGRVAAHAPAREVVWLSADSVRARRRAASADTAAPPPVVAIDSLEAAANPGRDAEAEPPRRGRGRGNPPAVSTRTHTVAEGETFFGIARRYGVTTAQLRAVNPDVDWERLEIGTVLRLPARARVPAQQPARRADEPGERPAPSGGRAEPARPTQPPAQPAGRRTHTVAQGETLYGIARRYGVTVDALKAANNLEGDRVRVGQTLVIPRAQPR
ncbi:MAG TPA: LysM peptidoglycan-binding domain-containing protein [Longimicrobium sp.]